MRLHQQRVGDRLWIANGPQGASILDAAERPEGFQALPEGVRVLALVWVVVNACPWVVDNAEMSWVLIPAIAVVLSAGMPVVLLNAAKLVVVRPVI